MRSLKAAILTLVASAAFAAATPAAAQHAAGQHAAGHQPPIHRATALADGGRFEVQAAADDAASVKLLQDHVRDFSVQLASATLTADQMKCAPGLEALVASRKSITFSFTELPRGASLNLATSDAKAVRAIHEFIASHAAPHADAAAKHGTKSGDHAAAGVKAMQACMAMHKAPHGEL